MIKRSLLNRKIVFISGALILTASSGLLFNAYYQADQFNKNLVNKAQIAVFLAPGSKVSTEVIREKLVNLDGVSGVDFVAKEKILETAQGESTQLKNLVLTGDNPFNPYFIVLVGKAGAASAKNLVEKIEKFEGVEDAAFDENLFMVLEKTGQFRRIYEISGYACAIIVLILIIVKFIFRLLNGDADFLDYLFNTVAGLLAGMAGGGLYYLLSRKFIKADVMRLPLKYLIFFIIGGALMVLLWEND